MFPDNKIKMKIYLTYIENRRFLQIIRPSSHKLHSHLTYYLLVIELYPQKNNFCKLIFVSICFHIFSPVKSSFAEVIHTVSTGFPHSYTHIFHKFIEIFFTYFSFLFILIQQKGSDDYED